MAPQQRLKGSALPLHSTQSSSLSSGALPASWLALGVASALAARRATRHSRRTRNPTTLAAAGAAEVKLLRERTGAGILDSKKALDECEGDIEKSVIWLKKKGIAKADKKAGNLSAEGVIASYVHFNNKIAVIVEVNSETDFVAKNEMFTKFANDVAMQIAANPTVVSISVDEVPADVMERERAIEMQKEDLADKPEATKTKIVDGRLKKKYEEMALLSQKWLKDETKSVQDVLKEHIAVLGENLVIRRFQRLVLGEGIVKKETDFAAGVEKELAKYRS